jgi:branched-chain amino acid aminotransferase
VLSHGLHYASAVFEGERAYNGVIFKLDEHTRRLFESAQILGFEIPYSVEEKLKGIRLEWSKWKRPSPETIPCKAKAAGLYMICTLSKDAAMANGYADALMLDYRGYVAEATGANVFVIKGDEIHTPDPDCFLNGLTRQTVIALAKANGYKVVERHIKPEELANYDECFLTGTAAEVTPVSLVGEYSFKPGKACETLINAYNEAVTPKKVAAE